MSNSSREPSPSSTGLGPSGFDPERMLTKEAALEMGYRRVRKHPDGHVYSMETPSGYRVVVGSPSYESACRRAIAMETRRAETLGSAAKP